MTSKPSPRPAEVTIRPWTIADRAAALAIFDSNVPDFFAEAERADFAAFLDDLPGPYFVCELDSETVGFGGYAIVEEAARADLCWGMVRRDLHGRGIGRALTKHRIDAARQDPDVRCMILNTSQHTSAFYEALGFVTEKVTPDGFAPGLDRCDMRLRF